MGYIAEESILELQRTLDIFDVISTYIPLKKAGSNFKALCPFHDEKTPSFMVNPHKQIFKCFGCGKGGDAIRFVVEYEGLSFFEAVKSLADKYGIKLKYTKGFESELIKENLYKVNRAAMEFFKQRLAESKVAIDYFSSRGLTADTIEFFNLGYAKDSWDALLTYGRKQGFSDKLMEQAGLVIRSESGSLYDRFRNRVIFPIFDHNSRAIGFGARTLGNDEPKYLNSPETALFSKGKYLYGGNLVKNTQDKVFYMVEGYFDVINPWQRGIRNCLGTMGTSPTADHIRFLRRYADKVIITFDPDTAGNMASKRLLDMLLSEDIDLEVSRLETGLDPSDIANRYSKDKALEIINNTVDIFDFLFEINVKQYGMNTETQKAKVINSMLESINTVTDSVKQDLLLQRLASKSGILLESLRKKISRTEQVLPAKVSNRLEPATKLSLELVKIVLHENKLIVDSQPLFNRIPDECIKKILQIAYNVYVEFNEIRIESLLTAFADDEIASRYILNIIMDDTRIDSPDRSLMKFRNDLERYEKNVKIKLLKEEKSDDEKLKKLAELKKK